MEMHKKSCRSKNSPLKIMNMGFKHKGFPFAFTVTENEAYIDWSKTLSLVPYIWYSVYGLPVTIMQSINK